MNKRYVLAIYLVVIALMTSIYLSTNQGLGKNEVYAQAANTVTVSEIIESVMVTPSPAATPVPTKAPVKEVVTKVTYTAPEAVKPITAKKYVVNAYHLNVRANPYSTSKILDVLKKGDVIQSSKEVNGWIKLDNRQGYISAKYVSDASKSAVVTPVTKKIQPVVTTTKTSTTVSKTTKSSVSKSNKAVFYPSLSQSVSTPSNLTAAQIEIIFDGTALEGLGEAFVRIEKEDGVNAFFAIAVAKLESGNGKSRLAQRKNNLFGLNATGNEYDNAHSFKTKADSVEAFGLLISTKYVDRGYTSIAKINGKYCPPNPKWKNLVYSIMKGDYNKLKKKQQL